MKDCLVQPKQRVVLQKSGTINSLPGNGAFVMGTHFLPPKCSFSLAFPFWIGQVGWVLITHSMLEGRLGSEFIFPSRIIAISQWVSVTPVQLQSPDLFGKTALWDYWGSLNCARDEHTESKPETGLLWTKHRGRRQCCFLSIARICIQTQLRLNRGEQTFCARFSSHRSEDAKEAR